jgi:putative transposase
MRFIQPLEPGKTFYLHNRSCGNINCFTEEANYNYFLLLAARYLSPVGATTAYCFLPDEYHILLKFFDDKRLTEIFPNEVEKYGSSLFLSNHFGQFILAYTNAFNKVYKRRGALFLKPFRRKIIEEETNIVTLAREIHLLPVEKKLCVEPAAYKFSSYLFIKNQIPSLVGNNDLINCFGTVEGFEKFHALAGKAA